MRRTPKLHLVGRAYSEMSPLNPDPLPESPTTSNAGQDRRGEQGGYGSMFPFGLLRGSFGRGGNANQVGSASLEGVLPICYVYWRLLIGYCSIRLQKQIV